MEANKVTIFLFLILVVVMAFSGFLIYDGLNALPAPKSSVMGTQISMNLDRPARAGDGTTVTFNLDRPS